MFSLLIVAGLCILPVLGMWLTQKYRGLSYKITRRSFILPMSAAAVYYIARLLPEPHITDESITLVQHFVGGGFVSAIMTIYLQQECGMKLRFPLRLVTLYAVVSSLGVANELLEFVATKTHIYSVDGSDVWWDLAANTLGAFTLYATYELTLTLITRSKHKA